MFLCFRKTYFLLDLTLSTTVFLPSSEIAHKRQNNVVENYLFDEFENGK